MYSYIFKGKRYDVGSKIGFLEANIEVALRDAEVSESLKNYLNTLQENMDQMLAYD